MIRVLVADDAPDIRLLIRVLLSTDRSLEIVGEAASPAEAIELAQELNPDVVVIDHGFRGQTTGLATAPTIKEIAPNCKIILFSAYDTLHNEVRATNAVDAFVLKTDAHELLAVVKGLTQS